MKQILLVAGMVVGATNLARADTSPALVRVGAKADVEGGILGEMVAQLARSAGARTEGKSLQGKLIWRALLQGEIDVYPEYTGTISQEILAGRGIEGEDAIRRALAEQGIVMTRPLGFNNTYAMGMKEERARKLGITKVSDLRSHPTLRLGLSNEFMGRGDGWRGLQAKYQLPHKNVTGLDHNLAYRALDDGSIDVTDLYSTDAEIRAHNLRVLEDDLRYFPAYQAVLLYRVELEKAAPAAVAAWRKLEGKLSDQAMMNLNARVQIDKASPARVAADYLTELLGVQVDVREESSAALLLKYTLDHLVLVAVSLFLGVCVAVPLGIAAARYPRPGQF